MSSQLTEVSIQISQLLIQISLSVTCIGKSIGHVYAIATAVNSTLPFISTFLLSPNVTIDTGYEDTLRPQTRYFHSFSIISASSDLVTKINRNKEYFGPFYFKTMGRGVERPNL